MIRVCVVDDQNLVRQGIKGLLALAQDLEVVGEASDGDEALEVIARTRPDVVLLDLRMPRRDGLGVLQTLASEPEAPPCLVLTTFDDDELVLKAIARGARGYLLKDVTLEQLTDAVRVLADGGSLINPAITARVLRVIERLEVDFDSLPTPEPLTARENQRQQVSVAHNGCASGP